MVGKISDSRLEIRSLTKIFIIGGRVFGSKLVAVNKANLTTEGRKPEILTIAGESGSGKTTLARMLLLFLESTSGNIFYKGKDITKLKNKKEKMWFRKEVQPIFQNPFESFNPLRKTGTYLLQTAMNFGIARDKKEAFDVVGGILKSVGLSFDNVIQKYPHELSGGQMQRASIARALITKPALLIADEPVSMVDSSLRISILNLFKDLKVEYGLSVIYITHDLATAYYISDRIAIMYRGDIIEIGPVEKVLSKPLHPYTQLLLESIPNPDPDHRWGEKIKLSSIEVKEYAASGCKFAERCPQAKDVCLKEEPEEVLIDDRSVRCYLYVAVSKSSKN